MAKISQAGLTFNLDALNNPVIKEIVVEKIIAVPAAATPDTGKITAVIGGLEKTTVGMFSKREEITLSGQYSYLGSASFKKADYEDDVTEFSAKAEYIIEAITSSASCTLKLVNFDAASDIAGSEISSGVLPIGKKRVTTGLLTMPMDSVVEIWGKKDVGTVDFLSSKILIDKKRKA